MSAPFGPEGQPWRAGRKRCRRWRPAPHNSSHDEPQRTTHPRVNAFQSFGPKRAAAQPSAVQRARLARSLTRGLTQRAAWTAGIWMITVRQWPGAAGAQNAGQPTQPGALGW